MSDYIEVTTTAGSNDEAQRIAAALVERRLAACAQVHGPITSTYWWQGRIETSEEWRCTAKTRRQLFDRVAAAIRELHSYQTAEILALPIEAGSADYLRWVEDELSPPDGPLGGTP